MKSYENTRWLVAFDVTEGIGSLTSQSFLGYMGAGEGGGTRGRCSLSRDDVNNRRAEGSVVRAGEALACRFWAQCRDGGDGRGVVGMGYQGRNSGNRLSSKEVMGRLMTTGGEDCVDLCASLFRVCGRYGTRAQKSRDTDDPSGGSRVLVAGIVMISTVGEAIILEGTASMQADGIDVGVSAISRRWDLATSICSEYFFSAEIGSYG